jgi:hypothetical protein
MKPADLSAGFSFLSYSPSVNIELNLTYLIIRRTYINEGYIIKAKPRTISLST